ncbi:MAG: rhomboid family intramembrane serine protease [Halofilum sp. (in: g-proteobacteria)]|nr:rhomboid family intramembrane serine protease [Halofilum sp. (in: g-proteobacteria)]
MADYFSHPNRAGTFPPVVQALLIGNGLVYLLQGLGGMGLVVDFALWPIGTPGYVEGSIGLQRVPQFHPWQLVTYSFLHGNLLHLFFNMFALWMFGSLIEMVWGSRRFLAYYFVCVIGAALMHLAVMALGANGYVEPVPTIGASGGVFGILLAFGLRFPNQYILLLIPPIPIKAKYFVLGYAAIELYLGITGTQAGVAHFAHLGGMVTGLVLILYWRGKLPWKPRAREL